ncbi:MAG: metallophosphoesterase [Deltaproteobacteria bacterium]|nr:metallophosphoesterase [Deltaproteobacteria bacterium]
MKIKTFNKYALTLFGLILLFATGVKIHSILTSPDVSDRNYHQLQKINHSKTNFSFAVFGDNKNSAKTFDNLVSKINKDNILFAIDDGDLVYEGENEKFNFFLHQIKDFTKPLLTVFGNHEAREKGRATYYDIFGKFYYYFYVGDSYFIILDDANEKNLDDEQFDWLKSQLKISKNYKQRFVFMHVPLYDPRKGNYKQGHSLKDLKFAKKLNDLFDQNNVTMLFTSHIHGYYKGTWGKTPYIITGGGGAELAGSDPEHYFYHYIKINISNSKINFDVVKLKSPDFELVDRCLHDTWIYIYSFFANYFIDTILLIFLFYLLTYLIFLKWDQIVKRLEKIRILKNKTG